MLPSIIAPLATWPLDQKPVPPPAKSYGARYAEMRQDAPRCAEIAGAECHADAVLACAGAVSGISSVSAMWSVCGPKLPPPEYTLIAGSPSDHSSSPN